MAAMDRQTPKLPALGLVTLAYVLLQRLRAFMLLENEGRFSQCQASAPHSELEMHVLCRIASVLSSR